MQPPLNLDLYQSEPWGCQSFNATVAARESHPAAYEYLREIVDGDLAEEAIFDLENDPWGMTNLISNPECKPVVKKLQAAMVNWREIAGDDKYVSERTIGSWWPSPHTSSDR